LFWNRKNQENQFEWLEMPGCFERHLQRRHRNPLFPEERRTISNKELSEARKKDLSDLKEFIKKYTLWLIEAGKLNDKSSVDDLKSCLQDTQELADLAAAVGGDLDDEISVIGKMENKIISLMNMRVPQGADLLRKTQSLSSTQRIPYFAQAVRKDSPILKSEELASLLSEDLETIEFAGLLSRSFPGYRPNTIDVKEALGKAIKEGLNTQYAKEVIEAFKKND